MKKILLVEDEVHVVSFIKKGLSEEGFEVSVAFDGNSGLQLALTNTFDLIILDIMLPELNGLEVCKAIRKENTQIPILFLTALGTSENIVLGLENGADDYLVKPFKFIELVARIKNLLRRLEGTAKTNKSGIIDPTLYSFGPLEINDSTKKVVCNGEEITFTTTEYKLLLYFIQNQTRVLSRQQILEAVWGVDFDLGTNVVDVYVNYLRKKIDGPAQEKLIHTVIGMGYVLRESNS
ncbi:response regulator transcription factor [Flavobacterium stagni]|uniref:Response regulator transcription factor n=1 Tax=Flavobacterium stagni TaxID=2506421 RepID=A0A4Q1KC19_9FLAO|nr:response regulator transcription factor [Flavobacterium stagni]RXR24246.1 response regulator transcription factor [Flavobacterium stagni]